MPLTYASVADYYRFLGYATPPTLTDEQTAVLTSRLARASAHVRSIAIDNGGVYALDSSTRKPSDPFVLEAFADAACAFTAGLFDREGDGLLRATIPDGAQIRTLSSGPFSSVIWNMPMTRAVTRQPGKVGSSSSTRASSGSPSPPSVSSMNP